MKEKKEKNYHVLESLLTIKVIIEYHTEQYSSLPLHLKLRNLFPLTEWVEYLPSRMEEGSNPCVSVIVHLSPSLPPNHTASYGRGKKGFILF